MRTLRTHTGFLLSQPMGSDAADKLYGNPFMNQLYLELINKPELAKNWEWVKKALTAISTQFHNQRYFFKSQVLGNQPMSPRAVDFIHSTLTFVLTGKRKLPVELWVDLLDYHPKDEVNVPTATQDHFLSTFRALLEYPESKFIAMWLSHPGGLNDLIVTAYALFGSLPENWKEV
jgi:hypothetical protein